MIAARIILFSTVVIVGQMAWAIMGLNLFFHFGLNRLIRETIVVIVLITAIALPVVALVDLDTDQIDRFVQGHWGAVPAGWRAYVVLCALGTVGGAILIWIQRRRPHPPAVVQHRSEPIDVAAALGRPPAGKGVKSVLARLPGNEIFRLDVTEMSLCIPSLPAALDGLSILHLTDPHLNGTPDREYFEHATDLARRMRPDLIALTGDILDRPSMSAWLPATLGRLCSAPLGSYFILGNHDIDHHPDKVRSAMVEAGWTDVGGTTILREHAGLRLLLAGTERPWHGRHPQLPPQDGMALRILLSHTPLWFGWARRNRFDLMLAGHLHGGQIRLPVLGSIISSRYACGTFHEGNTILHVSRGLGEMTPLRWRCPPEITKIVLRTDASAREATA